MSRCQAQFCTLPPLPFSSQTSLFDLALELDEATKSEWSTVTVVQFSSPLDPAIPFTCDLSVSQQPILSTPRERDESFFYTSQSQQALRPIETTWLHLCAFKHKCIHRQYILQAHQCTYSRLTSFIETFPLRTYISCHLGCNKYFTGLFRRRSTMLFQGLAHDEQNIKANTLSHPFHERDVQQTENALEINLCVLYRQVTYSMIIALWPRRGITYICSAIFTDR